MVDNQIIFRFNTRRLKIHLVSCAAFVLIMFFISPFLRAIFVPARFSEVLAEYKDFDFYLISLASPLLIFVPLWLYCSFTIFNKEWHLGDEGISLIRSGQIKQFIPWDNFSIDFGFWQAAKNAPGLVLVDSVYLDDPYAEEARLHMLYDEYRQQGEWFLLSKEAVADVRGWMGENRNDA